MSDYGKIVSGSDHSEDDTFCGDNWKHCKVFTLFSEASQQGKEWHVCLYFAGPDAPNIS